MGRSEGGTEKKRARKKAERRKEKRERRKEKGGERERKDGRKRKIYDRTCGEGEGEEERW